MKKVISLVLTTAFLALGAVNLSAAAESEVAPKSVIHVVTVSWKDDATPEQIQAALDGVRTLADKYDGITRIWLRSIKVQNAPGTTVPRTHAFVMEFASEQALIDYAESPEQQEWYKLYLPVREQSTSFDITN